MGVEDSPFSSGGHMKRIVAFGIGLVVVGSIAAVAQQPTAANREQCSIPGKGAFDVGWVEAHNGTHYRCLAAFDNSLKPSGAAWVQVVRDSRFIVKD
jgi:hypothetical protein